MIGVHAVCGQRVCLVVVALVVRVGGIEKEAVGSWDQGVDIPLAPIWNMAVRDAKGPSSVPDTLAGIIDECRVGTHKGQALKRG